MLDEFARAHGEAFRQEALDRMRDGQIEPRDWMELLARHKPWAVGTLVYRVAHPIAEAGDALFHTELSNCVTCAERMERWNG